MSDAILDASAVLAFLRKEPGGEVVRPWLRGGLISAVNAGEVLNQQYRPGFILEEVIHVFRSLEMHVVDFTFDQAAIAASLEPYGRAANLSFADRACLSLGLQQRLPIFTADRTWKLPDLGLDIRLIRKPSHKEGETL